MLLTESQLENLIEFNAKNEYYNILFEDAKKLSNEVLSDFFKEEKERIKLKLFLEGYSDEVIDAYVSPYDDNSHLLYESFLRDLGLGIAQSVGGPLGQAAGAAGVYVYGKEFMEFLEKDEIFSTIFSALGFFFSVQAIVAPGPGIGALRAPLALVFKGLREIIKGSPGLVGKAMLKGIRAIGPKLGNGVSLMAKALDTIADVLRSGTRSRFFKELAEKFGGRKIMQTAVEKLITFMGKITKFMEEVVSGLKTASTPIKDVLKNAFQSAFKTTAIEGTEAASKSMFKSAFESAWKALATNVRSAVDEILNVAMRDPAVKKALADMSKKTFEQGGKKFTITLTNPGAITGGKDTAVIAYASGNTANVTINQLVAAHGPDILKQLGTNNPAKTAIKKAYDAIPKSQKARAAASFAKTLEQAA